MRNYNFDPNNKNVQAKELTGLDSPNSDRFLLRLGTYIADGINQDYNQRYPQEIAIRDILDYDAVNVDISRFPLLKLYRQSDNYEVMDRGDSSAIIAYCLTYPQQEKLPGLIKYISKAINTMLDCYHYDHEECNSNVLLGERKAEYRIMVSEVSNAIYPFLRFNFNFREQ